MNKTEGGNARGRLGPRELGNEAGNSIPRRRNCKHIENINREQPRLRVGSMKRKSEPQKVLGRAETWQLQQVQWLGIR